MSADLLFVLTAVNSSKQAGWVVPSPLWTGIQVAVANQ